MENFSYSSSLFNRNFWKIQCLPKLRFGYLEMPINVFGNTSKKSKNKTEILLLVQKPILRANYTESNIEEDIDMKNQFRIKKTRDPLGITGAASKTYVDNSPNDPSIMKTQNMLGSTIKN